MNADWNAVQLGQAALEQLKQYLPMAGALVASGGLQEAGKKLVTWLQEKLTSKAAAGALEEAVADPTDQTKLEALAIQIKAAIEKDPDFREGLLARIPQDWMSGLRLEVRQQGDGNVAVQNLGQGNTIIIRG